jgi:cysteine desulfurase
MKEIKRLTKGAKIITPAFMYFDNSATTPLNPEVFSEMKPFFTSFFGNPSSAHFAGRESKRAIENARERVAKAISAAANEIFFTSGGTEADNWAIRGFAYANSIKGKHIITTKIEHHAVLNTCKQLEDEGYEITYLDVDALGMIDIESLKRAIRSDTILISIIYANNEVGTIQPIYDIGEIAKSNGICFHTDAVQAIGNIHINIRTFNVDLLSISGHKLYGPKGIGCLYIKKGTIIRNLLAGGAQEKNRRPGTENVPAIVGLGKAIEIACINLDKNKSYISRMRDKAVAGILTLIPETKLNGHPINRLPGNANISFAGIEGESLLMALDKKGIAASGGSACASGSMDPSHVLLAMGLQRELARGSIRFSFGTENTENEIDALLEILPKLVAHIRNISS